MNLPILFENDNYLIINKPSGLIVHADGKTKEPTVVDWIVSHYPDMQSVGEPMRVEKNNEERITIDRPGIVHRIDRETSGCLALAKTQESFLHLKEQFKNREVQKTYLALVHEWIKEEEGTIDAVIGRSPKNFRMKQAGPHARGKLREAQTMYRVRERLQDPTQLTKQGLPERYTCVRCFPKTGRTHQIRVHMKYLNHPIVSDSLYKGKRPCKLGLERTALHAHHISFNDIDGTVIQAQVEPPEDMQNALLSLKKAK